MEEAASLFEKKDSDHARLVNKSNHYLDETMHEIRRISRDLHPSILDDFGLMAAVDVLVEDFQKRLDIEVNLVKVKIRNLLPQAAKTALYRVTQEALTNIERHANASKVDIKFEMREKWFEVSIIDNGIGFDIDHKRFNIRPDVGIGLRNMSERLGYFKGRLDVQSSEKGTKVIAAIPRKLIIPPTHNMTEVVG